MKARDSNHTTECVCIMNNHWWTYPLWNGQNLQKQRTGLVGQLHSQWTNDCLKKHYNLTGWVDCIVSHQITPVNSSIMIKSTAMDKPVEGVRIRAHKIWHTTFCTGQEDEGLILAHLHCVLNCFTDSVTCAMFRTTILMLSISVSLNFYACTLNVIKHGVSVSTSNY